MAHTISNPLSAPLGLADHQPSTIVDFGLDTLNRATLYKDRMQALLFALVEIVKLSFSQGRLQQTKDKKIRLCLLGSILEALFGLSLKGERTHQAYLYFSVFCLLPANKILQ